MAARRILGWLLLGGGIACGARTGLEVPRDAEGGGGEGGTGGTGGTGGEEVRLCEELLPTQSAHVRLPVSNADVATLEMVRPVAAPSVACIAMDIGNEDGSWDLGHGCFDAWGPWPGSLGMALLQEGQQGGVAAAEGMNAGFTALLGNVDAGPARAVFDVSMFSAGSLSNVWLEAGPNRAVFLARSDDGPYFGGIARQLGTTERLAVQRIGADGHVSLGEIACAGGPIAAEGVDMPNELVVATTSARAFDGCNDVGVIGLPTRLQVLGLGRGGGTDLRFESLHDYPITDTRIVRGDGDDVWVGWDSGGSISVVHVGPEGALAPATQVTAGSHGTMAIARRSGELLVAYVPATKDNTAPDVRVLRVGSDSEPVLLGEFDTEGSTWLRDLELLVDPVSGSVIVAYVGLMGPNERAFARRLECR